MSKLFVLATKLHDACCPKCNGRCHCGSFCDFTHEPKDTDWETNPANRYFLELAKKAAEIITDKDLTEDQFVEYAEGIPYGKEIPADVYASMIQHEFLD